MDTKVILFPLREKAPWDTADEYIRNYLSKITTDKTFINHISQRMRHYIEKYAHKSFEPTFDFVVPPDFSQEYADAMVAALDAGIQAVALEVQDMMRKIIIERLFFEIEIYENYKHVNYPGC